MQEALDANSNTLVPVVFPGIYKVAASQLRSRLPNEFDPSFFPDFLSERGPSEG